MSLNDIHQKNIGCAIRIERLRVSVFESMHSGSIECHEARPTRRTRWVYEIDYTITRGIRHVVQTVRTMHAAKKDGCAYRQSERSRKERIPPWRIFVFE